MHRQIEKLKSKMFSFNNQKKKRNKSPNSGSWEVSFWISFGLPKPEEHFKFSPDSLDDKTYFSGTSMNFHEGGGTQCSSGESNLISM